MNLIAPQTFVNEQSAIFHCSDKISALSKTQHPFGARFQVGVLALRLLRSLILHTSATAISFTAAVIQFPVYFVTGRGTPGAALADARSHGVQATKFAAALVFGTLPGVLNPRWGVDICAKLGVVTKPTQRRIAGVLETIRQKAFAVWTSPFRHVLRGACGIAALMGARAFLRGGSMPSAPLAPPAAIVPAWMLALGATGVAVAAAACVAVKCMSAKAVVKKPPVGGAISDETMKQAVSALILEINTHCLSQEGIYRSKEIDYSSLKNACVEVLLMGDIASFKAKIESVTDKTLLPCLLKALVREMSPQLLPERWYQSYAKACVRTEHETDQAYARRLWDVMCQAAGQERLPILIALFQHLHTVALMSKTNKMTTEALANVWGASLLEIPLSAFIQSKPKIAALGLLIKAAKPVKPSPTPNEKQLESPSS